MEIWDDGIRLDAALDIPETGVTRCPLVIVLHGFTGNKEERHILAMSDMMNSLGFATLRPDLYGHGRSGGSFQDHTLYKWLGNVLALVRYAERLNAFSELYLCGHSQGGLTAMLAGAMLKDKVRGIIALSPAASIPENARRGEVLGLYFDPDRIPDVLSGWDLALSGDYVRVSQTIHVEDAIRRFDKHVLIVHGEEDETIPVEVAVQAAKGYSEARLVIIPEETHCYDHHLDLAVDAVRTWLIAEKTLL